MGKKRVSLLRRRNSQGFVTLAILQALIFIIGFGGLLIYQMQRIVATQRRCIEAIKEKALLRVAAPYVAQSFIDGKFDKTQGYEFLLGDTAKLRVDRHKETATLVILKVAVIRDQQRLGYTIYVFLERAHGVLHYAGIQLGAAL